MTVHRIEMKDVQFPLILEKELAGSYGEGSHKTLLCRIRVLNWFATFTTFVVQEKGKDLISHDSLPQAIGHYNDLP